MSDCIPYPGTIRTGSTSAGGGYGYAPRPIAGTRYAHRIAWMMVHGPIPQGMTVDHLCGNRGCINTAHMELVTRGENTRRGLKNRDRLFGSITAEEAVRRRWS